MYSDNHIMLEFTLEKIRLQILDFSTNASMETVIKGINYKPVNLTFLI